MAWELFCREILQSLQATLKLSLDKRRKSEKSKKTKDSLRGTRENLAPHKSRRDVSLISARIVTIDSRRRWLMISKFTVFVETKWFPLCGWRDNRRKISSLALDLRKHHQHTCQARQRQKKTNKNPRNKREISSRRSRKLPASRHNKSDLRSVVTREIINVVNAELMIRTWDYEACV